MKTTYKIFFALTLFTGIQAQAQVGIGTTNPSSAAILEISSTTKGFLPPRMTAAQRNAISSPVAGLEIWCTDCGPTAPYGEAQIYNGTIWTNLVGGTIKSVTVPGTNTSGGAISPIGIGTNTPAASAALEINSTNKGFLVPRMTATERNAIEPATSAAGLQVWCTDCNSGAGELSIFNGTNWTNSTGAIANMAPPFGGTAICDGTRPTVVKDVTHTYNGVTYTWMDRNLGASRAASVYNDYLAYGCSYQWGRGNDGHASVNWTSSSSGAIVNGVTTTLASSTSPGNALFINAGTNGDVSWMTTKPNPETRWQGGVNALNNPCPSGYRIPTSTEFNALINNIYNVGTNATSWPNAIAKLPVAGFRNNTGGNTGVNTGGYYHTSVGNFNTNATYAGAHPSYTYANYGLSVRCIKN
jgi:uncharacterized protein (TIGR02145 family)